MNRPRIIKADILDVLNLFKKATEDAPPPGEKGRQDWTDLIATRAALIDAQVVLFSTAQALALRPALDRFAGELEYRLPFQSVMLQFTDPIPESEFLNIERTRSMMAAGVEEDQILAMILSQTEGSTGEIINNAAVWFKTTSVNRVSWVNAANAHLRIDDAAPGKDDPQQMQNKLTIQRLAIACISYINCENIVLKRRGVPARVNTKRRRKHKRELPDYYLCKIRGDRYAQGGEPGGTGHSHSYRYDVRGHFRRLSGGRLIWVRPHQRGLTNELYKPKVYDMD